MMVLGRVKSFPKLFTTIGAIISKSIVRKQTWVDYDIISLAIKKVIK
jgi:hypothetical protein